MNDSEKQITFAPRGHVLTNVNVWSPDGQWIVYDARPDPEGAVFLGERIERVNVKTGKVEVLYQSTRGAYCGVATYNPVEGEVAFIHGPEDPTDDWSYAADHRRGVIVNDLNPGVAVALDARDLTEPFTPGALRGGSHVHVFSPDGRLLSFTYNDAVLARFDQETDERDVDLRNVGVATPAAVAVPKTHPRNHDGAYFSVLVTKTTARPQPGSDEISKAYEDAWVGTNGYEREDGSRQKRALAFQGQVLDANGESHSEVFIADLPDDLTVPGAGPLEGTSVRRPLPPQGVTQRRLTFTSDREYPGIQGPRHWLRSSPDGARIALLMKDDLDVVQIWTVSPHGGAPAQLTRNQKSIASAFTFSPDGRFIAHVMDNSVCVTNAATGATHRLTPRRPVAHAPRPEACVFSPNGRAIAYVRAVAAGAEARPFNQVFVCGLGGLVDEELKKRGETI